MIRRFFLLCVAWTLLSVVAVAQDTGAVDFGDWDATASQIQNVLESGDVRDARLEQLRADLVNWRESLQDAQSVNETEIETLETQLDALGPEPPEGETEPPDVAQRRADLNEQLSEARAPRIRAEEALARANVLIGQIDREIRARQANAFFKFTGTPLDPTAWPETLAGLTSTYADIRTEIARNVGTVLDQQDLRERAPVAVGLLLAALLLIARGPRWIARIQRRVATRSSPLAATVWSFLISLGEILLPFFGITLLLLAVQITGLLGSAGNSLLAGLNVAIFAFVIGRWLARRIFPDAEDPATGPFALGGSQLIEGRWLTRSLATLFAVDIFVETLADLETLSEEQIAVISLPVSILIGILLYRLGRLMQASRDNITDGEGASYLARTGGLLGGVLKVIAVVGPVAAAIGYYNMADGILTPTISTLALVGVLATLHHVVRAAWALIVGLEEDRVDEALVPILVTFLLSLAALPLLALAWGARPTDLSELWTRFVTGFQLGGNRIRPSDFLTFILVFALGFGLTRLVHGTLRASVLPRTKIDKGGQAAMISGLGYIGLTIALIVAITAAGIDLSSLAIVVGALGVGIGFGLQNIVNNFVSGIIMLIERPISEGDWVEVNGQMGIVKAISVRSTRIETFDRTDVIVPNGDIISGTVTNWTRGNSIGRVTLSVGVAYGTDTHRVAEILQEICEAHPMVAIDPKPAVFFRRFGADSLEFDCFCILRDVNLKLVVHSDLNHAVHERFVEEGIEIPFAQRDIWLRNPETLRGPRVEERETTVDMRVTETSDAAPRGESDKDDGGDGD